MPASLLDELIAADAQGERIVASLWPGDQFYHKGEFRTIHSMQLDYERMIIVTTTEEVGEPYPVPTHRLVDGERIPWEGEQKLHQPRRTFALGAEIMVPAILLEEHFREEHPDEEQVW